MKSIIVIACTTLLSIFISSNVQAKPPILTPTETPLMGEFDPYLLETLYKTEDNDTGLTSIVNDSRFKDLVKKNKLALFGGPMLGCLTDTSARIWVRTPGPAKVQAVVSKAATPTQKTKSVTIARSKMERCSVPSRRSGFSPS